MSTPAPQLQVVLGSSYSRDFQATDYFGNPRTGIYQGTDAIAGLIWPAGATQDSALAVTPTCSWIGGSSGATAGQWRYQLHIADTTGIGQAGWYKTLVKATRGTDADTLLETDLIILPAGGTLSAPAQSSVSNLPTASTLGLVSTLWCTDENIAVRCGPDFTPLMPDSQLLAWGSDGVFSSADPWTLTSASNNFGTQLPALWTLVSSTAAAGLVFTPSPVGFICWLRKPSNAFPAGGQLLAVAAVNGTSITLRRLGLGSNVGQAPAPAAGLTGVEFQIATFAPQIEETTYEINQRYNISTSLTLRTPNDLADIRPLRRLAVAMTLLDRYTDESRAGAGDYSHKAELIKAEIEMLQAKLNLRWGTGIGTIPQTSWFSTRIMR